MSDDNPDDFFDLYIKTKHLPVHNHPRCREEIQLAKIKRKAETAAIREERIGIYAERAERRLPLFQ